MSSLELSPVMEIATERPCRVGDAVDRCDEVKVYVRSGVGIGDGEWPLVTKSCAIVE